MPSMWGMEYEVLEIWGSGGPPDEPLQLYAGPPVPKPCATPESRALQQCKNEINMFYQEGKWDDYKKVTNPYEYIFLS